MTEEERPEAKEQEACFAAIREIVQEISRLMDAAYQQYSRLVSPRSGRSSESWTGLWTSEMIRGSLNCTKPSAAMSITNTPLLWESTLPSSGSSLRKRRMGIRILRR